MIPALRKEGSPVKTALLVLATAFLLATAFNSMGCGGAERGGREEEAEVIEATREEVAEQETEAGRETAGEVETEEEPVTGGSTQFSLESQRIGSGTVNADLRVTDIYWADYGEYFRIVFEFRKADGSEPTRVPNVHTDYMGLPGHEEYWNLLIHLDDILVYQLEDPTFAAEAVPVSLGHPVVKTMERMPTADTESIYFLVRCSYSPAHPGISSRPHRLMYATHPLRVIVDIHGM